VQHACNGDNEAYGWRKRKRRVGEREYAELSCPACLVFFSPLFFQETQAQALLAKESQA